MDTGANVASYSAANYFIEGLNEVGIDYLFSNMGTDHAPIIEAFAGRKRRGQKVPTIVVCPHENTAAHMAGGYAMVTGRGQGVLVHVDVGTANTANAMHNLYRSRLPVLLMAGKAPFTTHGELTGTRDNYVHFVQEPFDQGSLVRPYTKWEWTLPSGIVAKEVIRRAHTIMQSDPKGPVYLMLPREILTEVWADDDVRSYPGERYGATEPTGADPRLIDKLADALLASSYPILLASYAGRTPGASDAIEQLAEFAGIRLFEANMVNNIGHEGPCFCGFAGGPHIEKADFGLLVDVDVPFFPRETKVNEKTFWGQIDVDVLKGGSPMWSFPANLRLQGNSARIVEQLLEAVKQKASPAFRAAAKARVAELAEQKAKRKQSAAELAANQGKVGAINAHYLCAELAKRIARQGHHLCGSRAQFAGGAAADSAAAARHADPRRRRRARLIGRHGARRQARGAGPHDDPDRRRRQLLFQRAELGLRRVEAVQAADPLDRARQRRLVGGEGIDAARLSGRRRQGRGRVRGQSAERRRLLQGRRGVRRLWREGHRPGAGAGGARPRHQGSEGRPHRRAACDGDKAVRRRRTSAEAC